MFGECGSCRSDVVTFVALTFFRHELLELSDLAWSAHGPADPQIALVPQPYLEVSCRVCLTESESLGNIRIIMAEDTAYVSMQMLFVTPANITQSCSFSRGPAGDRPRSA